MGPPDVIKEVGAPVQDISPDATHRAAGLLGNARTFRRDPLGLLIAAHADGAPVVRIPLVGSRSLYSLAHPDAVRRALIENRENYVKGKSWAWLRRAVGVGLLTADGEESRWRRVSIGPAFSRAQIEARAPLIVEAVEETARGWEKRIGGTVDVYREMSDLTLRIIGQVLFSVDLTRPEYAELRRVFLEAPETIRDLIGSLSQFLPAAVPTAANRAIRRQRRILDAELDRMLDRRGNGAGQAEDDLVARMLRLRNGNEPTAASRTYITREEIREEIIVLIGAGHETTASLLASTWVLLARNPAVDRRLGEELAALPRRRDGSGEELACVDRVLEETLRFMPPGWGIFREAVAADTAMGMPIPAGSFVVISPYVIGRDERWCEGADRFDPNRPEDGSTPALLRHLAFGAGPRACIGKLLADIESRIALALLARRFRLELMPGRPVEYMTSVTLRPRDGTLMRVVAR
jgi:cytochrome P450